MSAQGSLKSFATHALVGTLSFSLAMYLSGNRVRSLPSEAAVSTSPKTQISKSRIVASVRNLPPDGGEDRKKVEDSVLGASDEEILRDIESRTKKGWPILQFEAPFSRKFAAKVVEDAAAAAAGANQAEYDAFFANFGLSADTSARFQAHIKNIHRASREYELLQQQILLAQYHFDRDVRETLGPDQYAEYRDFEKGKLAAQELDRIESYFAKKSADSLDSMTRQTLQQLVKEHDAYTEEALHGPFDPLPRVAVGKEQITAKLTGRSDDIRDRFGKLSEAAGSMGLPLPVQNLLQEYAAAKFEELLRTIELVKNRADGQPREFAPLPNLPPKP